MVEDSPENVVGIHPYQLNFFFFWPLPLFRQNRYQPSGIGKSDSFRCLWCREPTSENYLGRKQQKQVTWQTHIVCAGPRAGTRTTKVPRTYLWKFWLVWWCTESHLYRYFVNTKPFAFLGLESRTGHSLLLDLKLINDFLDSKTFVIFFNLTFDSRV